MALEPVDTTGVPDYNWRKRDEIKPEHWDDIDDMSIVLVEWEGLDSAGPPNTDVWFFNAIKWAWINSYPTDEEASKHITIYNLDMWEASRQAKVDATEKRWGVK